MARKRLRQCIANLYAVFCDCASVLRDGYQAQDWNMDWSVQVKQNGLVMRGGSSAAAILYII